MLITCPSSLFPLPQKYIWYVIGPLQPFHVTSLDRCEPRFVCQKVPQPTSPRRSSWLRNGAFLRYSSSASRLPWKLPAGVTGLHLAQGVAIIWDSRPPVCRLAVGPMAFQTLHDPYALTSPRKSPTSAVLIARGDGRLHGKNQSHRSRDNKLFWAIHACPNLAHALGALLPTQLSMHFQPQIDKAADMVVAAARFRRLSPGC